LLFVDGGPIDPNPLITTVPFFNANSIFGNDDRGGFSAYSQASHEIILLGETANSGSINANDIVVV